MKTGLTATGCYGLGPPHYISVDVYPAASGSVKLNSEILPTYIWNGEYYQTELQFKAIPTNTTYVFHHWEFARHVTKNHAPLSLDSVAIDFNQDDQVIAYFTDITSDIAMPTGFSPNGDGNNDFLFVLGTNVASFELIVYNRWGEEIFKTTSSTTGWDGTYKGEKLNPGVFAYKLYYKQFDGSSGIKNGNITLIR